MTRLHEIHLLPLSINGVLHLLALPPQVRDVVERRVVVILNAAEARDELLQRPHPRLLLDVRERLPERVRALHRVLCEDLVERHRPLACSS